LLPFDFRFGSFSFLFVSIPFPFLSIHFRGFILFNGLWPIPSDFRFSLFLSAACR